LGSTWRISASSPLYGLSLVVGSPFKEEIRVLMFSWREVLATTSIELSCFISKDFVSVVCCSVFHKLSFKNSINSFELSLKNQIASLIS
jgi:hypothetical protein